MYKLTKLAISQKILIWKWRNKRHIREAMYNSEKIKLQDHNRWFEKIINSDTDIYFVLLFDNKPIGLVYFNNIDDKNNKCHWGFYIGEDSVPKGSGSAMGYLGLEYIFNELKFHKVIGEVLERNTKSINFHEKMGFIKEGNLRKEILKNGDYIDIIRYGILKEEWMNKKEELKKNLTNEGVNLNEYRHSI
ncbi:UDP-4-amino-4,6-dideoxy-N-acetyl-beta-L-altrosamine N-acetyltransferase [Bacillus sp. FJAT-52991]|uniref:UDP-4-amino-4, 6-dideoxy-N-acetyl-beta-L-altrosamine N-acetyltransferase n=1 Tax=Bacillus kandeliae TaxID=3129297 RepID=A0ABZ2N4Y6_9BACI